MKYLVLFIVAIVPLLGCETITTQNANNLDRPERMVIVCTAEFSCGSPLGEIVACDSEEANRKCGFITNGANADLAVVDLTSGFVLDNDPRIPGYTRIPLSGQPGALLVDESEATLYTVIHRSGSSQSSLISARSLGDYLGEAITQDIGAPLGPMALVEGSSRRLWVAHSDEPILTVVPLDAFGEHSPASLTTISVSGIPSDLQVSPDGTQVFVAYADVAHLTAIEEETLSVRWNVSIAPHCMDGFDNDGDGAIDGADLDCLDGALWSESPAPLPASCSDGFDNDGDGLVDYPADPGCHSREDHTEASEVSGCEDGLDGDGDGLVDQDDPDCSLGSGNKETYGCSDGIDNDGNGVTDTDDAEACSSPEDASESALKTACEDGFDNDQDGLVDVEDPDCLESGGLRERSLACNNGLDDDGDGVIDADDPDCFSRSGASEHPKGGGVFGRLAVSGDGQFLYATNRALAQVFVVDLNKGTLIDVNNRPPGLGQPLLAAEEIRGIPLPAAPLAITFTETQVTSEGSSLDAETALVTTIDGQIFFIDALVGTEEVHLLRPITFGASSASTPALAVDGEPIEQTFSVRSDFANLGAFGVDTETLNYHGITLRGQPLAERTETWTLTHQGSLPESASTHTRLTDFPVDSGTFVVSDPTANFCRTGVEPGDYLSFHFSQRQFCDVESGDSGGFVGDQFEYPILAVNQDSLVLSRTGGIAVIRWTEEERNFLTDIDIPDGTTYSTQAPPALAECLQSASSTSIRVPKGVYTAIGGLSGFQHGWTAEGGLCVPSEKNEARGRVLESKPSPNLELEECLFPLDDSLFEQETPFTNDAFTLTVRPGCEVIEVPVDAEAGSDLIETTLDYRIANTPRSLALSFRITSGYQPRRLLVAHIPEFIAQSDGLNSVYIVDSGLNRVVELNPTTLQQGAIYD